MSFSLKIAFRYLFSKKSTNAINVITGISVVGIAIGTAALILVLSVFNGFEELIVSLMGSFKPDIKVIPAKGKTFSLDTALYLKLNATEGVSVISEVLEEIAFLEYNKTQGFATLKGVDAQYQQVTRIDSTIREGKYQFVDGERNMAIVGGGIANALGINTGDMFTSMNAFMPKRKEVSAFEQPFKKRFLYPAGIFLIQQEFDNQYIICGIDFMKDMLETQEISALEIKMKPNANKKQVIANIQSILGANFIIKDRNQQDEAFLKIMNLEKWLAFAVTTLTLLLVAFNIIGCLWMIVLEKKKDIAILKSMGAEDNTIRNIFINEGMLISLLGIIAGIGIALIFYFLQKKYGLVGLSENFVVSAYPISLRFTDLVVVCVVVLGIGILAALPSAFRAKEILTIVRED